MYDIGYVIYNETLRFVLLGRCQTCRVAECRYCSQVLQTVLYIVNVGMPSRFFSLQVE